VKSKYTARIDVSKDSRSVLGGTYFFSNWRRIAFGIFMLAMILEEHKVVMKIRHRFGDIVNA
jgi:hypothetical protein